MNLLIVNNDIIYSNSLKVLLEKNMEVNSIQIARDFKSLLKSYTPSVNLILFEVNAETIKDLKQFKNIHDSNQVKFVALTDKTDNEYLLETIKIGVSAIIHKMEKIEFILEELNMVLRGKASFPEKIINNMKEILVIEEQKESFHLINIFSKYISSKKENHSVNE